MGLGKIFLFFCEEKKQCGAYHCMHSFIYYSTWAIKELLKPQCYHTFFLFSGNNFQGLEFLMEFLILSFFSSVCRFQKPNNDDDDLENSYFRRKPTSFLSSNDAKRYTWMVPDDESVRMEGPRPLQNGGGPYVVGSYPPKSSFLSQSSEQITGWVDLRVFLQNYGTLGGKLTLKKIGKTKLRSLKHSKVTPKPNSLSISQPPPSFVVPIFSFQLDDIFNISFPCTKTIPEHTFYVSFFLPFFCFPRILVVYMDVKNELKMRPRKLKIHFSTFFNVLGANKKT